MLWKFRFWYSTDYTQNSRYISGLDTGNFWANNNFLFYHPYMTYSLMLEERRKNLFLEIEFPDIPSSKRMRKLVWRSFPFSSDVFENAKRACPKWISKSVERILKNSQLREMICSPLTAWLNSTVNSWLPGEYRRKLNLTQSYRSWSPVISSLAHYSFKNVADVKTIE